MDKIENIQKQKYLQVDEVDIEDMFSFADKDKDGRISYRTANINKR